jgi:(2Fe-2S) ferredoxin
LEIGRLPFKILILVCTNTRGEERASCGARGAVEIHQELKRRVKLLNLPYRVRVSQSGCLDLCSVGPNVLVIPGERLYSGVALEDIDRILEETFGPLAPPADRLA